MTAVAADRYADWKAPAADGEVVIWPPPDQLLRDTRANAAALSAADGCRVQNVPVPQLRREMRAALGHAGDAVLVATGHQTELYHPGVWVKDVLIDVAAAALGGIAVHVAVDTDQPKHLAVRWPGTSLPVTDDPAVLTADWSGQLAPPTPAHVDAIAAAVGAAAFGFQPMLPAVLDVLRSCPPGQSLSAGLTEAQLALDRDLGLTRRSVLASPLWSTRPFLTFAHHVLARAHGFASDYNGALADYRAEAGIASATRPMPDLRRTVDAVEVPFWFDDLSAGHRKRAEVVRAGSGWALAHGEDRFALDVDADGHAAAEALAGWLSVRHLRLAPRALTLTTFLRLLVVDQFVHGIGGGRYDQVTDRLLAAHFGAEPPRFAVTTATLLFPGSVGRQRVCLPCVHTEGHTLRHGLLGDGKRAIVAAIDALPRRSAQRAMAFSNLHAALSAAAIDSPVLRDWSARLDAAVQADRDEQVLFDRELFYAVQPRDRLADTIGRYRDAFA